jgi:hypothetical protein
MIQQQDDLIDELREDAHLVAEARCCRSDETSPHKAADRLEAYKAEIEALLGGLRTIAACCEYEYGSTGPRSTLARILINQEGR